MTKGGPCVCARWLNFNHTYGSNARSAVLLCCKMVRSPPTRFKGTLDEGNTAGLFWAWVCPKNYSVLIDIIADISKMIFEKWYPRSLTFLKKIIILLSASALCLSDQLAWFLQLTQDHHVYGQRVSRDAPRQDQCQAKVISLPYWDPTTQYPATSKRLQIPQLSFDF